MGIESAMKLLTPKMKDGLSKYNNLECIDEIRLRRNRNLSVVCNGLIVDFREIISNEDMEYAFKNAFNYSMHCYSKELAGGYITVDGGNRVGLCGTAVIPSGKLDEVDTIKYISSINIRISREILGYGEKLYNTCLSDGLKGLLIIGPPSSGKTTLLRDIARLLGRKHKVSLIDEMNELSYSYKGVPQLDVGKYTDVFVGYPKHIGIRTAVKVMSPEVIVCDEIGSKDDMKALEYALHSGVHIISAVHGLDTDEVMKKRYIAPLFNDKAFSFTAEIHRNMREYSIKSVE